MEKVILFSEKLLLTSEMKSKNLDTLGWNFFRKVFLETVSGKFFSGKNFSQNYNEMQ